MRIFNRDGTEAEMCGNGIRCLAKFLYEKEVVKKANLKIETLAGIKTINLIIENKTVIGVKVDMGGASFEYSKIPVIFPNVVHKEIEKLEINVDKDIFIGYPISVGNPHFVCFVDDLQNLDINKVGPIIENYKYFPNRTNIEFVEIKNSKNIKMRVWERGVGETLGCGTGACASAVISYLQKQVNNEVMVELPGGKLKVIYFKNDNKIILIGDSHFVFNGELI
jgi:diaminopimelate epimerase